DVHDLLHGFEPPVPVGTAHRTVHAAGGAQRVAQRVCDDGERPGGFAPLPGAEKLRRPREGVAAIEVVRVDDGKRAADRGCRRQPPGSRERARRWPSLAGASLARACSTTRRTPSASGVDARQSQVRRATAGSSEIRAMSPRRSPAWVGPFVYPVAAATSRNSSRSETSRPHATLATPPEGPPPPARSPSSSTSPT